MYGAGFTREGHDTCRPSDDYDDSYVYRVDLKSYTIDQVIPVGPCPSS